MQNVAKFFIEKRKFFIVLSQTNNWTENFRIGVDGNLPLVSSDQPRLVLCNEADGWGLEAVGFDLLGDLQNLERVGQAQISAELFLTEIDQSRQLELVRDEQQAGSKTKDVSKIWVSIIRGVRQSRSPN